MSASSRRLQSEELCRFCRWAWSNSFTIIAQIQSHWHFFVHAFVHNTNSHFSMQMHTRKKTDNWDLFKATNIYCAQEDEKTYRVNMWDGRSSICGLIECCLIWIHNKYYLNVLKDLIYIYSRLCKVKSYEYLIRVVY